MKVEKHLTLIVLVLVLVISAVLCIQCYILVRLQQNENIEEANIKEFFGAVIKGQELQANQLTDIQNTLEQWELVEE